MRGGGGVWFPVESQFTNILGKGVKICSANQGTGNG